MAIGLPVLVAQALADSKVYHVDFAKSTGYNDDEARTEKPADECNVITSELAQEGLWGAQHRVLLDLDIAAELIPSSTPGHSHLYIDVRAQWEAVENLLDALVACGVIEEGYANASKLRKHTALRMPGVVKSDGVAL